jgi:ABC-type transporter Mla subunit MlaD
MGRMIDISPDAPAGTLSEADWSRIERGLSAALSESVMIQNEESKLASQIKGLAGLVGTFAEIQKRADATSARFRDKLAVVSKSLDHMDQFADELDSAASDIDSAIGQFSNMPPAEK